MAKCVWCRKEMWWDQLKEHMDSQHSYFSSIESPPKRKISDYSPPDDCLLSSRQARDRRPISDDYYEIRELLAPRETKEGFTILFPVGREVIRHPSFVDLSLPRPMNLASLFPEPGFTPCGIDRGFGAALMQESHNPGFTFTPFIR